jgi:hypothetical protein
MIVTISRDKPFELYHYMNCFYRVWKGPVGGEGLEGPEEWDSRSVALKVVDLVKEASFETGLIGDEKVITGEDRFGRLRERGFILADVHFGLVLCKPVLNWIYEAYNVTWFEIPGTVLRDHSGERCVLFWCRHLHGGGWYRGTYPLSRYRDARGPALVLKSYI